LVGKKGEERRKRSVYAHNLINVSHILALRKGRRRSGGKDGVQYELTHGKRKCRKQKRGKLNRGDLNYISFLTRHGRGELGGGEGGGGRGDGGGKGESQRICHINVFNKAKGLREFKEPKV